METRDWREELGPRESVEEDTRMNTMEGKTEEDLEIVCGLMRKMNIREGRTEEDLET